MNFLYNYLPLKFLSSLFEKGIYFKYSNQFEDKSEGSMPEDKFDSLEYEIIKYQSFFQNASNETTQQAKQLFKDISKLRKNSTFVSCWHNNTELSQFMWENYAKKQVYIKTTACNLVNSLPSELLCIFKQNNTDGNIIGPVIYMDINEIDIATARDTLINGDEHKFKGLKYTDENEYRMIIEESTLKLRTKILSNKVTLTNNQFLVAYNQDDISIHQENDKIIGIYIRANPSALIDEIGVGSREIKESVIDICKKYNISPTIKHIET